LAIDYFQTCRACDACPLSNARASKDFPALRRKLQSIERVSSQQISLAIFSSFWFKQTLDVLG
jgi:sulfite reductase beta subunit-like hemoprotein